MLKLLAACCLLIPYSSFAQAHKTLKDSVFKKGDTIRTPAIFFGLSHPMGGESILDSIKPVADFLKLHPELYIEIGVHTDTHGNAEANLRLSESRAKSVRETLVHDLHVDSSQVSYKGYGESMPVIPESQIKKAKTQEEANTLQGFNRRTELIVKEVLFHELPSQALNIGETRVLYSSVLHENRSIHIVLPYNYDNNKTYPVLYLLDGSRHEDLLHIAGLVQFYNMLGMPEFIIAGISNVDRKRDFTFHTDLKDLKKSYPTTGHSEAFIRFLETELQPYMNRNFKTNGTNYIIGQSLGGLLATEILLKKPQLFTHYLIVSPSLWWDNESLLKKAGTLLNKLPDGEPYVYISVGGKEEQIMQDEAKTLSEVLKKSKGLKAKTDLLILPEENHATILHQSISEAFKLLFPYKKQ